MEELLRAMSVPSAALETSLDTYTDLLCSLLDIPVYKSRIQVYTLANKTKPNLDLNVPGPSRDVHIICGIQEF